ncbi:DUF5958 family protein [Streptomyces sp. NRRL WC-3626]|uniref:DUF5958 family protein n=1 Tax=Streptomyces sp. NRRL WC-3626 TaxID=1463926 RepID=UPI000A80DA01|nr:DUF5958 family protein [Streptomyces sp. NRRL WC-3626]
MTERDIILNELAQGLRPMSQGIEWFDAHGPEEQAEVLLFLRHHCVQARAVTEDAPESIRRAGLRPTHTRTGCHVVVGLGMDVGVRRLVSTAVAGRG